MKKFLLLVLTACFLSSTVVWAKSPALLRTAQDGPEYQAALTLGKTLCPDFQEVTADGLAEVSVLWIHLGDSEKYAVSDADASKIRAFVEQGGGLFLTGASWPALNQFGLETVLPRQLAGGHDHTLAAVIPLPMKNGVHPVFRGL